MAKILEIFTKIFKSRDKPSNSTAGSAYRFSLGGSSSGKRVTERSAMQMTAVYSCVRILAEVWKKANPFLDITVGIDKVKVACESAKQNPAEENSFRQLRLNQWVKQAIRWMPMDKWDACAFKVTEEQLRGRVCYGGLDLINKTPPSVHVLPQRPEGDVTIIIHKKGCFVQ